MLLSHILPAATKKTRTSYVPKPPDRISSGTYVEVGDVLLPKITPSFENGKQGIVANIPTPFAYATTEVFPLHANPEQLDSLFLFFYLKQSGVRTEIAGKMEGTTGRQRVPKAVVENYPIPLPPLPEQRRIAHVLSTIQQAIAAQDAVIAAARELKRSLMQRLFTYGPYAEPLPTKETEIGEVPEGWEIVPLMEVIRGRIQNGAFIKRDRFGQGTSFLNVADMYKSTIVQPHLLERVQCSENDIEKFGLERGDLVFVRSSLKREGIGECIYADRFEEPTIYDCHLMRVKPDTSTVEPKFVAHYALSPQGKKALIARSKTTTMTTINQAGLASLPVPLPSLNEQRKSAHAMDRVEDKIAVEVQRRASLQALFKSMLHQLMSGRVRAGESVTTQS